MIICKGILNAQVSFRATLSPHHQEKLNRTKDYHKKMERYRKLYKKDSTRQAKDYWKKYDSTAIAQAMLPDSLKGEVSRIQQFPIDDRKQMLALLSSQAPGYEEERAEMAKLLAVKKDSTHTNPDSLTAMLVEQGVIKTEELAARQVTKMGVPGELQNTPTQKDLENSFTSSELEGGKSQFNSIKSKVPKEKPVINEVALQLARTQMSGLMKKYSYVPNSNDLSTAVKRKSLKGAPLRRRLFFGGNVHLASTDPVIISTDFQSGYKFHRDFMLGVGLVLRESFEMKSGRVNGLMDDAFGYSFFANHDLFGGKMFVYSEFQRMRSGGVFMEPEGGGIWQNAMLAGVGKEFKVLRFLNMTAMILYDLNHKNNTLYPSPFVTKIGYRFSELALW